MIPGRQVTTTICRASLLALSLTSRWGMTIRGDKYKWSIQLTAVNVTNKVALYH